MSVTIKIEIQTLELSTSKTYSLDINSPLIGGRGKSADIKIADQKASRKHFKISLSGSQVLLEDLESTNGLKVNDSHVLRADLFVDDVIEVGSHKIKLLAITDDAAPQTGQSKIHNSEEDSHFLVPKAEDSLVDPMLASELSNPSISQQSSPTLRANVTRTVHRDEKHSAIITTGDSQKALPKDADSVPLEEVAKLSAAVASSQPDQSFDNNKISLEDFNFRAQTIWGLYRELFISPKYFFKKFKLSGSIKLSLMYIFGTYFISGFLLFLTLNSSAFFALKGALISAGLGSLVLWFSCFMLHALRGFLKITGGIENYMRFAAFFRIWILPFSLLHIFLPATYLLRAVANLFFLWVFVRRFQPSAFRLLGVFVLVVLLTGFFIRLDLRPPEAFIMYYKALR